MTPQMRGVILAIVANLKNRGPYRGSVGEDFWDLAFYSSANIGAERLLEMVLT